MKQLLKELELLLFPLPSTVSFLKSRKNISNVERQSAELRDCVPFPPLHPFLLPLMFAGCLGISCLTPLQGYVKIAVMWKSWDAASKRLEMRFTCGWWSSLQPSLLSPLSSPAETRWCSGELQNFLTQCRTNHWSGRRRFVNWFGRKVHVWERKVAVVILVRKEEMKPSRVCCELGTGGLGCHYCLHLDPH